MYGVRDKYYAMILVLNKILISRMKNADFNIGEQAVLSSILKDLSKLNGSKVEVLENTEKSLKQKYGIKASHSYLPISLKTLRSISKANVLVWGGGNMLQDQSSSLDIPYHLINVFLAQVLRIPVILYGVEIGPINTRIGTFFSKKALNRVDLILVRNKRSESALKRIGINNPNIYITADPAFLVSPDQQIFDRIKNRYGIRDDRPIVCIAPRKAFYKISGLIPATLRLKLNLMPRDFHAKFYLFKLKMAQICDYLVREFQAQILFLAMDVAKNPRDDLVCREILDMMVRKKDAYLLNPGLNPSEVSGIIKAMDLVISQRLHALILSCCMNTPMVGISTTGEQDKCKMFMEDIGQGNRCFDASSIIDENKKNTFFALLDETWKNRETINNELRFKAHDLKEKASMNIELLSRYLNNIILPKN